MSKVLAFRGSPRKGGNSTRMLEAFEEGVRAAAGGIEVVDAGGLALEYCRGCLQCNLLRRCRVRRDGWPKLAERILAAEVLVFAAPVYFHHLPASLKKVLDRFRSFLHVELTETGLAHTPWREWRKTFVLLLSMGSSNREDARPLRELFEFLTGVLGEGNRLHVLEGTRLAVAGQVDMDAAALEALYPKLGLPGALARQDAERNRALLEACRALGRSLAREERKE